MTIATGYFAKAKAYHDMGYALVNVALKRPWFLPDGLVLHEPYYKLAPTEDILKLKDSPKEYTERYRIEILRFLSPWDVGIDFFRIGRKENTDKVVMLCYESPEKFCHRHVIAEWMHETMNIEVKEIETQAKEEGFLF